MNDIKGNNQLNKAIAVVFIGAMVVVAGCAEIGGQSTSILPRTKVLDPLEVPPGMSPLPEPEQFVVPGELAPGDGEIASLSPEQLRAYQTWLMFEEYRKYQEAVKLEHETSAESFHQAKASGKGLFRVQVVEGVGEDTIYVEVHENADKVFERLPPILSDMTVIVHKVQAQNKTILVSNAATPQKYKLRERFRLKKFSGSIDQLQVAAVGPRKARISALTDTDVLVNSEVSREFFQRLRNYLLAHYQNESEDLEESERFAASKQLIKNDDGDLKIVIAEEFDTTWTRLSRALRGIGAGVQDVDRSQGIFYVSFGKPAGKKKKNWRFWQKEVIKLPGQENFQVTVSRSDDQTEIRVAFVGDKTAADFDPKAEENFLLLIFERLSV